MMSGSRRNDSMPDPLKISGFTDKIDETDYFAPGNTSKLIMGPDMSSDIKARINL